MSIASNIDLNTLDALSSTCRQIRVNLLQFRNQLLTSTLHCENETVELNPEHTFRYRARAADWYFVDSGRDEQPHTGKVGDCARDMVRNCRRCDKVVCRVGLKLIFERTSLNWYRIAQSKLQLLRSCATAIVVSVRLVKMLLSALSSLFRASSRQAPPIQPWQKSSSKLDVHAHPMACGSANHAAEMSVGQMLTTKAYGNGAHATNPP